MFYYLEGTVAHTEPGIAVIDVGGAGYMCRVSQTTLSALTAGQNARLYTQLIVREDAFELFGFHDREEQTCFKLLLGVSGVGPKAALSILSACPPARLALSVITSDEKSLTKAQGVGKKLAQRVILELRDKMTRDGMDTASAATGGFELPSVPAGAASEAVSALMVLGYSSAEAAEAVKGIDAENLVTEQIVMKALKKIAASLA